jgi:hypothetical protein
MRNPFLRADERNDLGEWIEAEPKPPVHPAGDRFAERRQSHPEPIAIHRRDSRRCGESLGRTRRRSEISVAGAEVNDVDAALGQLALPRRDRSEGVLGKRHEARNGMRH